MDFSTGEHLYRSLGRRFLMGSTKTQAESVEDIIAFIHKTFNVEVSEGKVLSFVKLWKRKWELANRSQIYMDKHFSNWLNNSIIPNNPSTTKQSACNDNKSKRTVESFESISESQKRRRTTGLRKEESSALVFATSSKLRNDGKLSASKIVKQFNDSPTRADKILSAFEKSEIIPESVTQTEAVALMTEMKLTKEQYEVLRKWSKKKKAPKMLASYGHAVVQEKKKCYPENISIGETEAIVELQSLLDHTGIRLITSVGTDFRGSYTIYYKWGMDASSGFSPFKQAFNDSDSSDSTVFITTIVPVLIENESKNTVWENPAPNSTRLCRPVRIKYEKETKEAVEKEYNRMQIQISNLQVISTIISDNNLRLEHKLFLTMVDTKIVNTLEGNKATTKCFICGKSGIELNNIEGTKSTTITKEDSLKYGVSPLHARIKFMEFLLHLAYRTVLPENRRKKGIRLNENERKLMGTKKACIQSAFKEKTGILLDTPKHGFGSSNDGNTSRRFFDDTKFASEITGINEDIIHRFSNILIAINSSKKIDTTKFGEYALSAAKKFNELYGWFNFSPTVHKVLLHGEQIMKSAILPVGVLSEEPQEGRHKDFKSFRTNYARKISRKDNMTDIFNRFLVTSDPLVVSQYVSNTFPKKKELPTEVAEMLVNEDEEAEDSDSSVIE